MKNRVLLTVLSLLISFSAHSATPEVLSASLIPKPVSQTITEGYFKIDKSINILSTADVDERLPMYLRAELYERLENFMPDTKKGGTIVYGLVADETLPSEGYRLTVGRDEIRIEAADRAGLFYGTQTLLQMMPPADVSGVKEITIPCQSIHDYPRFGYRGAHLDVARTFSNKDTVLKFVDRLAAHKLNRFHWHLTDDEGWRIELKCYPELAEIGGFRGGDSPVQPIYGEWNRKYGGYFTQDEIKEVVEYAAMRNIEIIPEIDLPGHSRTAAKVFPHILCGVAKGTKTGPNDRRDVWCASKEENYKMLDEILTEVCGLFPSQYFHVGGDEVSDSQWGRCPDCQRLLKSKGYTKNKDLTDYFISRMVEILEKNGKLPVVWDEAAESGRLTKNSMVTGWRDVKTCLDVTGRGYKTIIMPGSWFYIDMKQSRYEDGLTWAGLVPIERLYSFNFKQQGFTDKQMENVAGVESAFWSELYLSHDYSYLDYQTYPRICALAEVAWTQEELKDWDDFYRRLTGAHFDRLAAMGVQYRVFLPKVDYVNGVITVTPPFEGAVVRYTTDGNEPNAASPIYKSPIRDDVSERYLFRAFYGDAYSGAVNPSGKYEGEIGASASTTFQIPLSDFINSNGTWCLRINTPEDNLKLDKVTVQASGKTTTIIGGRQRVDPMSRIRIRANDNLRTGVLHVTIKNENPFACPLVFELEKSPYMEPAVTMTSSMKEAERFPFKNVADYNFSTYSRTTSPPKKGDHITFTFAQPVDAASIEVFTGLNYLPRYHIPAGRVQISADGNNFTDIDVLKAGKATIRPEGRVKAIKVISESDGNSENAVAIQDLKIIPRR